MSGAKVSGKSPDRIVCSVCGSEVGYWLTGGKFPQVPRHKTPDKKKWCRGPRWTSPAGGAAKVKGATTT